MSLINALYHAQYGVTTTERRINVASANVANADREGYTRKSYSDSGALYTGSVTGVIDRLLATRLSTERTNTGYHASVSAILAQYDYSLGTTGGETGVNKALGDMLTSLSALATTPELNSGKTSSIQDLETLTYNLRKQSADIQALRQQADSTIATTVNEVNDLVRQIDTLNTKMVLATDSSLRADIEDQRTAAIEALSQRMGISYFYDSGGKATIYTSSGQLLLGSSPHTLSFNPTATITSTSSYPATLNGVMLDGVDITTSLHSGSLGGLLDLRDTILVNEQAALDNFAVTVMREMNTLHNQGASIPAPSSLTGSTGFAGTDPIAATGTLRIATVSSNGTVGDMLDIDLSTVTDLNDLMIQLNSIPNVSASITPDGRLRVESTDATLGIALSEMDSNVTATNQGISSYLGLNNLFDTNATSAADIYVRSDIRTNPDYFATSRLSQSAALTAGDTGITAGDGSNAQAFVDLFDKPIAFAAAGDIAARSETLTSYMQMLGATSAQRISTAKTRADEADAIYNGLKQQSQNASGVNVNEELTNVTVLQNAYSANAQVISVVKQLFETLIQAVR